MQPLGEVVEADGLLVVGDAGGVAARGDVVGTVVHVHFSQTLSGVEGVQIEDRPCEAVDQQAGAVRGDCLACELRGLIGDLGFKSTLCPCFSCRRAFPTFRRCAEFPCFRPTFRRCAESSLLRECPVSVFLLPPWLSHLPKVCRIPAFSSHLPKVRGVVTASRAPCISVSPAAVAFPPSEGVQDSRVFVSPSEGGQSILAGIPDFG